MPRLRYVVLFALAIVLVIAVRLPVLRCEAYIPGAPLLFDELDYVRGAKAMAIGDTSNDLDESWMRAPGTAWTLLSIASVRGVPVELAACDFQRLQVGLWVLLLLLVASIARMLFDRRTALISAILLAILPVGVGVTLMVHADTIFAVAFVVTVWALLHYARRPHLPWLVVAGAAAGCAGLVRSPILPLLPLLLLWIGASTWARFRSSSAGATSPRGYGLAAREVLQRIRRTPARAWLHVLVPCVLFFGCVSLVLTPWTVRNYRLYGGFVPSDTTGAVNLFDNNAPVPHVNHTAVRESSNNPVERQRYAMQQARAVILADPLKFARKFIYTSWIAWSPEEFHRLFSFYTALLEQPVGGALVAHLSVLLWLLVPLALLGLLVAPRSAPGANGYVAVMAGMALIYTAMMAATHFEERYRMPFLLLWLPFAAWCLAHPRAFLAQFRRPLVRVAGAVLLTLAISYITMLWPFQWNNLRGLALYGRGLLIERTDPSSALAADLAAAQAEPRLLEAQVAAARITAAQGNTAQAEQMLRQVLVAAQVGRLRPPADATVTLQKLLAAEGRFDDTIALDANLPLRGRRSAEALAWRRGMLPGPSLQLPTHDLGLVDGFYPADPEYPFRWSGPEARVLLAGQGDHVCLHMNLVRPPNMPAPTVELFARRDGGTVPLGRLHPPRSGWAWMCAPLPLQQNDDELEIGLRVPGYNPFGRGDANDVRDLGVALQQVELRSGPLQIDTATGLLLDHPAPSADPPARTQLIGLSGATTAQPGTTVSFTMWWRGEAPPLGTFTFLHVLDANGQTVAAFNAPLASDQRLDPPVADEPLIDLGALPLPADLPPGSYRLVGGAFNPADGAQILRADLGELVVNAP